MEHSDDTDRSESREAGVGDAGPKRPRTTRGERTRSALVAAARRIFERDGYLNVRLSDIPAEAGCASGTLYTYFNGKEDIFEAVLALVEDDMLHGDRDAAPSSDPLDQIRSANRSYLESYQRHALVMRCFEQAAVSDPHFQKLRSMRAHRFIERNAAAIRRLQAEGVADPALDPELASKALSAMVSRVAFSAYVLEDPVPLDDLVEVTTRLWANALWITGPHTP
ncbi:TetR/AcrR family transcriptional regulator [Nocardioides sp. Y6]|uniref:TetR/AcrR family transcriptional regulator n=1 Tax=Nocardioides malaquae TaxID=2773426 RepID=A0ABR9RT21_9ACTN|nr:TetR/AcrR family transcriptional regulator [Nocardioides malaquae]MBE7324742.1 TetR/AcrR family transcriptional regulator [Nocardioides malaquae]